MMKVIAWMFDHYEIVGLIAMIAVEIYGVASYIYYDRKGR